MIETPISDWSVVVALLFGAAFGSVALTVGIVKICDAVGKTRSKNA